MSRLQLILTSRLGLVAAYGEAGYDGVLGAIDRYAQELNADGWRHRLLIPDDPDVAALWSMKVVTSRDASAFASAVYKAREQEAETLAVLIIGGPDVVPFHDLANDANDGDPTIPSDNPYGCRAADSAQYLQPDLIVGRLVGSAPGDLASLIEHIRQMAFIHRTDYNKQGGCAVGSEAWLVATQPVASVMGAGAPIDSPTFKLSAGNAGGLAKKLLFFNLHGYRDQPQWSGQGSSGASSCVSPSALGATDLAGTVIFATNCYGAHIHGKTRQTSCALASTAKAARAFVGSTNFAYGAASKSVTRPLHAEKLGELFFGFMAQHQSTGGALLNARNQYRRLSTHDPDKHLVNKTSLQFILLGDPTL